MKQQYLSQSGHVATPGNAPLAAAKVGWDGIPSKEQRALAAVAA